jgi:hypothetical protein
MEISQESKKYISLILAWATGHPSKRRARLLTKQQVQDWQNFCLQRRIRISIKKSLPRL